MQARGTAEVRIVGGHPALDLVNTVGCRRGSVETDYHLASFDDLLLWATRQGVLDESCAAPLRALAWAEPDKVASALARAKNLRECLWRMGTALRGQEGPPRQTWHC